LSCRDLAGSPIVARNSSLHPHHGVRFDPGEASAPGDSAGVSAVTSLEQRLVVGVDEHRLRHDPVPSFMSTPAPISSSVRSFTYRPTARAGPTCTSLVGIWKVRCVAIAGGFEQGLARVARAVVRRWARPASSGRFKYRVEPRLCSFSASGSPATNARNRCMANETIRMCLQLSRRHYGGTKRERGYGRWVLPPSDLG